MKWSLEWLYSYISFVALVEVAKYKILDSRIKCLDIRQEGMVDTLQGWGSLVRIIGQHRQQPVCELCNGNILQEGLGNKSQEKENELKMKSIPLAIWVSHSYFSVSTS